MYLTLEWNWFPAEQHVCFCLRLRNPKWKSCSDIHFIHFRWWQTVAAASSPHPSAPSQQLFNDKTVVLMLKVGTLVFPHRKLIRNQYGNRSRIGLISRIWTWEILKGATTMNKVRLVCVCEGEYRSRGVVIIKTLERSALPQDGWTVLVTGTRVTAVLRTKTDDGKSFGELHLLPSREHQQAHGAALQAYSSCCFSISSDARLHLLFLVIFISPVRRPPLAGENLSVV